MSQYAVDNIPKLRHRIEVLEKAVKELDKRTRQDPHGRYPLPMPNRGPLRSIWQRIADRER